jgi:hypothetical protein
MMLRRIQAQQLNSIVDLSRSRKQIGGGIRRLKLLRHAPLLSSVVNLQQIAIEVRPLRCGVIVPLRKIAQALRLARHGRLRSTEALRLARNCYRGTARDAVAGTVGQGIATREATGQRFVQAGAAVIARHLAASLQSRDLAYLNNRQVVAPARRATVAVVMHTPSFASMIAPRPAYA